MQIFTRQLHSFPCEAQTKTAALSKLNGMQQINFVCINTLQTKLFCACTLALDSFGMSYFNWKPTCILYTSSRVQTQGKSLVSLSPNPWSKFTCWRMSKCYCILLVALDFLLQSCFLCGRWFDSCNMDWFCTDYYYGSWCCTTLYSEWVYNTLSTLRSQLLGKNPFPLCRKTQTFIRRIPTDNYYSLTTYIYCCKQGTSKVNRHSPNWLSFQSWTRPDSSPVFITTPVLDFFTHRFCASSRLWAPSIWVPWRCTSISPYI